MPSALAICVGLTAGLGRGEFVGVHHGRAAAVAALGARGVQPGHRALVDDVPLELGERRHHGEEELALAGWRVGAGQLAGEDADADTARVKVVGDGEDFLDGPAEAVELLHGERVALADVA